MIDRPTIQLLSELEGAIQRAREVEEAREREELAALEEEALNGDPSASGTKPRKTMLYRDGPGPGDSPATPRRRPRRNPSHTRILEESRVFARYRMLRRALANLEKILEAAPDHAEALALREELREKLARADATVEGTAAPSGDDAAPAEQGDDEPELNLEAILGPTPARSGSSFAPVFGPALDTELAPKSFPALEESLLPKLLQTLSSV